MERKEIESLFEQHWKNGWGSVSVSDLMIIQDLIKTNKPQNFIELGTASGISAGIIALMMEENDGQQFHTVDHNNTFFGDESKENGFLINEVAGQSSISINQHPFTTAVDVKKKLGLKFDMGFIDANHRHPWPTIDTLCLYPLMNPGSTLIYDDYSLFQYQRPSLGIGPKYIFDQLPESHKSLHEAICDVGWLKGRKDDLFTFDTDLDKKRAEDAFHNSLSLPWTDTSWVQNKGLVGKIIDVIEQNYSGELKNHFELLVDFYQTTKVANKPTFTERVFDKIKR